LRCAVTAYIAYESIIRLLHPVDVLTQEMLLVACVGLAVNIASILLLHGYGKNISIRSAVAHMMADAVSSVAIVIGALIMARTGWKWIDPLLSIGIAGVILVWAWGLFRDTARILMEVAPAHVNTHDVERFALEACPEVAALHRVRIWSITEDVVAFSAEVVVNACPEGSNTEETAGTLARALKARFDFAETTLEMRLAAPKVSV